MCVLVNGQGLGSRMSPNIIQQSLREGLQVLKMPLEGDKRIARLQLIVYQRCHNSYI